MPVPNIVAAASKILEEAEKAQLGGGERLADARRDRGICLRLEGMRRGRILVRISATSRPDSAINASVQGS